jgi:hypothetical protein
MSYQNVFPIFWNKLEESIKEKKFAKLTMAKTIGKQELKNIFIRPIYNEQNFKVLLKFRFRPREIEDIEEEMTLDKAFVVISKHLKNPFLSVIMFTTTKDLTFKINKKGVGSLTEKHPTFQNITEAKSDV